MNKYFKIALFLLSPALACAQPDSINGLRTIFKNAPEGALRFKAASDIYFFYQELNRDSALFYAEQQRLIGIRNNNKIAEGVALDNKSYQLTGLGKYADALTCVGEAFTIAENPENDKHELWNYFPASFQGNYRLLLLSYTHHVYALLMLNTENLDQQILHFKMANSIAKEINYIPRIMISYLNLGESYLAKNKPDSALYYEKEAEQIGMQPVKKMFPLAKAFLATVQLQLGDIYKALKNDSLSLTYYYRSLETATESNNRICLSRVCLRLGMHHLNKRNKDSTLYYSLKNLGILQTLGSVTGQETNLGIGYKNIYLSYKLNNQIDSAFKYQGLALTTIDSLDKGRIKNLAEFQKLTYSEQLHLQTLEQEKVQTRSKIFTYSLLAGLAIFLLIGLILYRNNRQKQKSNIVLQEQKQKVETTLSNLKSTQAQLIQSEKMASLGELTAGIAHEIQNPLNFVNNFSEVNREMIDELLSEKAKMRSERDEDLENELLNNIKDNEEKINHHGKRADAIVKGMLQHSKQTSGTKEPTDITALCDEYLRLSYHGLRAKDKSFNADFKTDFDKSIDKINIVPQDIGRVLLNLFNNAFYAVSKPTSPKGVEYKPLVSVTTRKIKLANNNAATNSPSGDGGIEIIVSDNGSGIPSNIIDKIFQPFFTTKPTGQGTGLGLSLAYDIITKEHNGTIKVESKEGEGSKFVIQLPNSL